MDDEKISGIWQEEHDVGHAMDPLCKEEEQEPELHQVGQNQDESQDEVEATQGCREAKDEEKSRDELGEVTSGDSTNAPNPASIQTSMGQSALPEQLFQTTLGKQL